MGEQVSSINLLKLRFVSVTHWCEELGLMSTTQDINIAIEYSQNIGGHALLLKFKVTNMKQFGADVSWLSAFPTEKEILYPPLTFLEPTGRVETSTINGMAFTTVEIEPHV